MYSFPPNSSFPFCHKKEKKNYQGRVAADNEVFSPDLAAKAVSKGEGRWDPRGWNTSPQGGLTDSKVMFPKMVSEETGNVA